MVVPIQPIFYLQYIFHLPLVFNDFIHTFIQILFAKIFNDKQILTKDLFIFTTNAQTGRMFCEIIAEISCSSQLLGTINHKLQDK